MPIDAVDTLATPVVKDPREARITEVIANLRLEVDALKTVADSASLPTILTQARKTIRLSAILIAAALIVSSVFRLLADKDMQRLEQRIEQLEQERIHAAEKPPSL